MDSNNKNNLQNNPDNESNEPDIIEISNTAGSPPIDGASPNNSGNLPSNEQNIDYRDPEVRKSERYRLNKYVKPTLSPKTLENISKVRALRVKNKLVPDIDQLKKGNTLFQLGKRKLDDAYNFFRYPLPTPGDFKRQNSDLHLFSRNTATRCSVSAEAGKKFGESLIKFLEFKNDVYFYGALPWGLSYGDYADIQARELGTQMLQLIHSYRHQLSETNDEDEDEVAEEFWLSFRTKFKNFLTAENLHLGEHGEAYKGSLYDRDHEEA